MKISFGTRIVSDNIHSHNGYGYATKCMLESLQRLGYHVSDNDSTADVEIWFDQPHHWNFSKGTYKIGYHPWESTQLMTRRDKASGGVDWAEKMNECDEIWTPSPLIADWYRRYNGITVPIYVYEHGIEHDWEPRERKVDDRIKFLHVGAEASRKRGWETRTYFRKAFPNRDDVSLTLKTMNMGWYNIPNTARMEVLDGKMAFNDLQNLFYDRHVYVYPSYGEGFGLTPFQALATGMPTITVPDWAPYAHHLDTNLNLKAELRTTNWPDIHPGKMFHPWEDDIIDKMRYIADNYESCQEFAMKQAPILHEEYDWDRLTEKTFSALKTRLELQ
jgi:glycosyltransferase involved in cell wall biosynthesis